MQVAAVGKGQGGLAQLARGFRINLRALSLLSLLVGAFLVHETMRLSVVARRRSFGVLRALGAQGRALFVGVAAEALVLGLVGSIAGAGLGVLFSFGLLEPLVQALNDHYATFELRHVDIDPVVLCIGVGLGTLVALLAGLGPAIAAARVPAREVLVTVRRDGPLRHGPALLLAVPAALLAVVLLQTTGDRLVQAYLGIVVMLVAIVAVVPLAMEYALRGLAVAVRSAGPFVRYVVRSTAAARRPPRVACGGDGAGTRDHGRPRHDGGQLPRQRCRMAHAGAARRRLRVGAGRPGREVPRRVPTRTDRRAAECAAGGRGVDLQRTRLHLRGGRGEGEIEVCGMAPTPAVLRGFGFVAGDDVAGREALVRGEGPGCPEPLAFRWGLQVGDRLTMTMANGPATIPIAAVHRDYSNERGEVIVGKAWLDAHAQVGITAMALQGTAGLDVEAWVQQLRARAAEAVEQDVLIRSNHELRSASLVVFDRTFAITGVMRLLCLMVAFFGIYAAFATLQLERGAEIGLLRCLGARPQQIGLVVLGQTALLGLVAGGLAVPVGALFGHVLAGVINRVSFGWSLPSVSVPSAAIGEVVLLAVGAALLAGVQPAVRFARMRPVDGLREA